MSGQFTPGPWRVVNGDLIGGDGSRVGFSGGFGFALGSSVGRPDRLANSQLAIAAPELLEALERAISYLDRAMKDTSWADAEYAMPALRAVAAKARGGRS